METCAYTHDMKYSEKGEIIEKKKQISAREYVKLLERADKSLKVLIRDRNCFIFDRT